MEDVKKRSFLSKAKKPFSNLSPTQKLLFALRCGCSIISILLVVVLAVFQRYPRVDHVAKISCAHMDVARGFYGLLQEELNESAEEWDPLQNQAPHAPAPPDSSVSLLSDYSQQLVALAPQSILLAYTSWCSVVYSTNFMDSDYLTGNTTVSCHPYTTFGLFNYRQMMSENNLEFVIAYVNQTTTDQSYVRRTDSRQRRFDSMRVLFYTQALSQGALLISCFIVYSNRGRAKDLSKFRRTSLHVVASLAVQAAISIVIASAVVSHDLLAMQSDITKEFGSFGVVMHPGKLFKVLFWLCFCFSIISSFSWILPVWCSNPPKKDSELVYSGRSVSGSSENPSKDKEFVIKPYRPRRGTIQSARSSRLFDDEESKDDTTTSTDTYQDDDETDYFRRDFSYGEAMETARAPSRPQLGKKPSDESNLDSEDPAGLSSKPAPFKLRKAPSEIELRRLGRKMTKNASVRTRRTESHELDAIYAAPKEDTHNLLYGDNPFGSHQYPNNFGKSSTGDMSRGGSLNSTKRQNSGRTRQLLDGEGPPPLSSSAFGQNDSASLLNEDEAQYLDHNQFVNRV